MKSNEAGFTLLEVLVAMVIMGIGFSMLVQGFMQVNTGVVNNQTYTYLSSWAISKMNELAVGIDLNNHGTFRYREQIYDWWLEEYYIKQGLKKLVLKVEWKQDGRIREYSISRFVTNWE